MTRQDIGQETLYINGKISCMRPAGAECQAMLVRGEAIEAVGRQGTLKSLASPDCRVVDLGGKRVLPGLIDTHAHFLDTGFSVTRLNLGSVKTMADLLSELADAARAKEPGQWIMAVNYDENRIAEKRMPTLAELDQAVPDHPVYINHRGYHSSLLNTRAQEEVGLDFEEEPDLRGGAYISRANNAAFKAWIAERTRKDDLKRAMAAASDLAVKRGLTTVHCIEGGEFWGDAYAEFCMSIHRICWTWFSFTIRTILKRSKPWA